MPLLMTSTDGTTTVGPCIIPLTSDDPNHVLSVTQYDDSELELLSSFRTINRAHNNNTLPIELWVYIFTLASTAYPSLFDVNNRALWNGRLTLAVIISVCQLWRSAALGVQSLWSTIVLPSGSKHIQKCLETSLYYSNKSLIDIFFFRLPSRQVYDNDTQKAREHKKILDILSHNDVSSRLRTLSNIPVGSLTSKSHQIRREIGDFLRDTSQTIQAVGILHWEHSTRSDSTPLSLSTTIGILECLPVYVRRISIQSPDQINGMIELLARPTLQNLWGRLSHLKITGPYCIYLVEATDVLRRCVTLEECQLSWVLGVFFEDEDMNGPLFGKERLILPHLRQLVIQKFDGDATWLLDALSCPVIVNLAVAQDTVISREDMDHAAAMRWESFIQRSFSMSSSPKDVLHEIWVHGLPKSSVEYLLSSHAAKSVRSIALARSVYTLTYPGCAEWSHCDFPSVPSLDLHDIYIEAAEEYGLLVADILQEYETVPWYGWNRSVIPLRLSAFAIQSLEKATIGLDTATHFDTTTHFDTPTHFDTITIVELD